MICLMHRQPGIPNCRQFGTFCPPRLFYELGMTSTRQETGDESTVRARRLGRAQRGGPGVIELTLSDGIQELWQVVERMRLLHPKLTVQALTKRLEETGSENEPSWLKAGFWEEEIDLVLLEAIQRGAKGRDEVIAKIHVCWPKIGVEALKDRLEELASSELPAYLQDEFWAGGLDGILLAGLKQGRQGEKAAINKILKIHPGLRVGVIQRRLRRLARRVPEEKVRRGITSAWTEALDGRLMEVHKHKNLPAAVTELQSVTGWPRHVIYRRAHKLGIQPQHHRKQPWTAAESKYVVEHVNHRSVENIAKALDRSVKSVWRKIEEMGLSGRREDGYSALRLARDLRVRPTTVRNWIRENRLKRGRDGHIKERTLIAFFKDYGHNLKWNQLEPGMQALLLECLDTAANKETPAAGVAANNDGVEAFL